MGDTVGPALVGMAHASGRTRADGRAGGSGRTTAPGRSHSTLPDGSLVARPLLCELLGSERTERPACGPGDAFASAPGQQRETSAPCSAPIPSPTSNRSSEGGGRRSAPKTGRVSAAVAVLLRARRCAGAVGSRSPWTQMEAARRAARGRPAPPPSRLLVTHRARAGLEGSQHSAAVCGRDVREPSERATGHGCALLGRASSESLRPLVGLTQSGRAWAGRGWGVRAAEALLGGSAQPARVSLSASSWRALARS